MIKGYTFWVSCFDLRCCYYCWSGETHSWSKSAETWISQWDCEHGIVALWNKSQFILVMLCLLIFSLEDWLWLLRLSKEPKIVMAKRIISEWQTWLGLYWKVNDLAGSDVAQILTLYGVIVERVGIFWDVLSFPGQDFHRRSQVPQRGPSAAGRAWQHVGGKSCCGWKGPRWGEALKVLQDIVVDECKVWGTMYQLVFSSAQVLVMRCPESILESTAAACLLQVMFKMHRLRINFPGSIHS